MGGLEAKPANGSRPRRPRRAQPRHDLSRTAPRGLVAAEFEIQEVPAPNTLLDFFTVTLQDQTGVSNLAVVAADGSGVACRERGAVRPSGSEGTRFQRQSGQE